jgi:hypothetical protein
VKSMKISRTLQKMISKMSPSSSIDQKGFMECFHQSRLARVMPHLKASMPGLQAFIQKKKVLTSKSSS